MRVSLKASRDAPSGSSWTACWRMGLISVVALGLSACASSSRIQSGWVGPPSATARIDPPRPAPVYNAPAPAPVFAAPEPAPPVASTTVLAEPLAPPPGARAAVEPPPVLPPPVVAAPEPAPAPAPVFAAPVESRPVVADVPAVRPAPEPAPPLAPAPSPAPLALPSAPSTASLPPASAPSGPIDLRPRGLAQPAPQAAAGGSSRSAVVGGWTARDATGSVCRVVLSSAPALDLYRASAGSCQNRDLSRVTAWDYRDGEVYLYQAGGTVAARLRTAGSALEGALSKSGAPLTMTR